MTAQEFHNYVAIASAILAAGGQLIGQLKTVFGTVFPGNKLTDEQINAIENAGVADSEVRRQQRIAMGQPSS